MSSDEENKLKAINIGVFLFAGASIAIVVLTILNYLQDGKLNLSVVVVVLMLLSFILILRGTLKKKNK